MDDRVEPPEKFTFSPWVRCPPCDSSSERIVSPGSRHGEVHGHVRLCASVRLDVRVLGAEQRLRAVDRELLDLVDDLAAAVVAAAGIALGVLVRRPQPTASSMDGQVKFSDAISSISPRCRSSSRSRSAAISGSTSARPRCGGRSASEGVGRHPRDATPARPGQPKSLRPPGPHPRGARGARGPVRSSTVDGMPGSSPPSRTAATPARISVGHIVERDEDRPPVEVRARRRDHADAVSTSAARPGDSGTRTPIVSGLRTGEPGQAALRVRHDEGERPRDQPSLGQLGTSSN